MANKNILIRRRKDGSWENIFPITVDSNVVDSQGVALPDKLTQIDNELNNAVYLLGNSEPVPNYGDLPSIPNVIPSHWVSHINSKIDTINNIQNSGGSNVVSFGFITDIHSERNANNYGSLMERVAVECNIRDVINGGDTGSRNVSKLDFIDDMNRAFNLFGSRRNRTFFTMGNHDDNPYGGVEWNRLVKTEDQFTHYFSGYGSNVSYGNNGTYYFVDDMVNKIRYIVLNSLDIPYIQVGSGAKYSGENMSAFRQEQLTWFGNTALNVPDSSWSVVVTSHNPPYGTGVTGFTTTTRNSDLALGILSAFKNKTTFSASSLASVPDDLTASVSVNFNSRGGNVICWVSGHTHSDNSVVIPTGNIRLITTINDSTDSYGDAPVKTRGTTTEQAFDIFTVNTNTKTVNLTRIGAGSNRQFTY